MRATFSALCIALPVYKAPHALANVCSPRGKGRWVYVLRVISGSKKLRHGYKKQDKTRTKSNTVINNSCRLT